MAGQPMIGMKFDGGIELLDYMQAVQDKAGPQTEKMMEEVSDFMLADVKNRIMQIPPEAILAAEAGMDLPPGSPTTPSEYANMVYQEKVNGAWVVGTGELFAERLEFGFTGEDDHGNYVTVQPQPVWRPAAIDAENYINSKMNGLLRRFISG